MNSIQKTTLKKKADDLEKEITDFLETLPANDNICGVGFEGVSDPTNDNNATIDKLEIGLDIPASSREADDLNERDTMNSELNFEEGRVGRRGFLAEDIADFSF